MFNKYLKPTYGEAIKAAQTFERLTNAIQKPHQTEYAFQQLDTLSHEFYRLSLDDHYQCSLPRNVKEALQSSFRDFNDWVHRPNTQHHFFSHHGPLKLIPVKIILIKMARFIIWKTFGHPSSVPDSSMMIVKLALTTAELCLHQEYWRDMEWCLMEASSYELQPTQLPAYHKVQHYKNLSQLAVLRVYYAYGTMETSCDGLVGFFIRKLNDVELNDRQSQEMSDICYYMGSGHFVSQDYVSAQPWLKSSYHFAKRMNATDRSANTLKALVLLVKCLLKDDPILHRNMILHLLGLLDENIVVAELRMETWMAGKTQSEPSVRCAAKLFCLYLTERTAEARIQILKVFNNLKEKGHSKVILELLNRIPWRKEGTNVVDYIIPTSLMPQMRWILAEVAVLSCLMQHDREGCLLVLRDIALWIPNSVNSASLQVILEWTKSEAFKIDSPREALVWFQILVDIGRRNGVLDTELLIHSVRVTISLDDPETLFWAQQILNSINDPDMEFQLLRLKLFLAVRGNNENKAIESWLLLETKYKKEKRLDSTGWEEGCALLENCVLIGLEHGMSQVVVHCLSALDQELERRYPYTIALLSRIARFVVRIFTDHCKGNLIVEKKCVDFLIKMLINATRLLTLSISDGEEDSSGPELWFGGVALSLASSASVRTTSFERHQLYKCHYKLLNLTPNKHEKLKEDIGASIWKAMAAGISAERQPNYIDILNSCLSCVADYNGPNLTLVRFYEFYIMCELGDVARVEEAVKRYRSEGSPVRLDARFFDSLACLASSDHRAFLKSLLPDTDKNHLLPEEYRRPRDHKLQMELTEVAIKCMRKVIHLQVKGPLKGQSISSSWQKVILLAQENIFLQEESMERYLRIFHEYLDFIRANREHFNASEINLFLNESWNATVNITNYKGKKAAERWMKLVGEVPKLSAELEKVVNELMSSYHFLENGHII